MTEWNPTPRQIASSCKRIQAGWDDAERYRRMVGFADGRNAAKSAARMEPYTVPVVAERDLQLAVTLESLAS